MFKTRDLITELAMPLLFAGIAVFVIFDARSMRSESVFPTMVAAVLLACSVYWMGEIFIRRKKLINIEGLNIKKMLVTLAALAVYVLVLRRLGYVISTLLLVGFIIRALGYKNYPVLVLCSILTVGAVFLLFKVLLGVPLPLLLLDF